MRGARAALVTAALWLAAPASLAGIPPPAASAPRAAAPDAPADPAVKAFLESINRDPPESALAPRDFASAVCTRTVTENLDFDAFLARAAIRIVTAMTDQQRTAFRVAAQSWLVRQCVDRNRGRERLEFVGLRTGEGGDRLLATRSSATRRLIIWRLRGTLTLTATDLIVDGSSTAQRLRSEVASLLRAAHGDVDAMITRLGHDAP